MAAISTVKKNYYQDSVKLMRISQILSAFPGVSKASAVMATEANLQLLKDAGLIESAPDSPNANDLIVAVEAQSEEAAKEAMDTLDSLLVPELSGVASEVEYKSLDSAYSDLPGANLVCVSIPGQYARIEVAKAIDRGLHTFLFSDNLTIEEEIELKERATARGLLMMGPGCGTAIINGVGLGFANLVRRGPIGVVGAAGTGMQEVTSLIHNLGSGISHAIGVGGRDLSEGVGGLMMIGGIRMLQGDGGTEVLLLVSKPPSKKIAEKVISVVRQGSKPAVLCFLGGNSYGEMGPDIRFAPTLEEAALEALKLLGMKTETFTILYDKRWKSKAGKAVKSLHPNQRYLRGLYSGGTFCFEAQQVLTPSLGKIYSNAPLDKQNSLEDSNTSKGHSCIDLGEEEFTQGRPHPMIDLTLTKERMVKEASDPQVAVILFDVVLGYVSSSDPAGDIAPAVEEARAVAEKKGRSLGFVAHVCGTEEDPQGLRSQEEELRKAGVLVFPTNAQASRVAGWIATRGEKEQGIS